MALEHFFVRHGHYGRVDLSFIGHEQAAQAAEELIHKNLGRNVLLMSSDAPRAAQTADVISEALGTPYFATERLNIAGQTPEVVRDLDEFLHETATNRACDFDSETQFIVVAHAPLLAVILGHAPLDYEMVEYGQIVPYEAGSWNDQYFDQGEHDYYFPASEGRL